jgi:hypothetical protein
MLYLDSWWWSWCWFLFLLLTIWWIILYNLCKNLSLLFCIFIFLISFSLNYIRIFFYLILWMFMWNNWWIYYNFRLLRLFFRNYRFYYLRCISIIIVLKIYIFVDILIVSFMRWMWLTITTILSSINIIPFTILITSLTLKSCSLLW